MEILLRAKPGTNYEWRKAEYVGGEYCIAEDEFGFSYSVNYTDILAVRDDERIGKVQCSFCGAFIENNPESIEQHYAEEEAKRDCLKCKHMGVSRTKTERVRSYELVEGSSYNITEKYTANLTCGAGYWSYDINGEEAKKQCDFYQHRRYGVHAIDDIFVKYPEPFVQQLTVDVLNANKYPFVECQNGYFIYDLKCRGVLKAAVNELGIVDHFITEVRTKKHVLYYSDKYNKLFRNNRRSYEDDVSEVLSETKINCIINKISKLFKEAEKNDNK